MSDQTAENEKAEKARLADLKMAEMRLKNEMLMKRHEEIEADKRNANMSSKMAGLKVNEGEQEHQSASQPTKNKSNSVGRSRAGGGGQSRESNKPPGGVRNSQPGGGRSPSGQQQHQQQHHQQQQQQQQNAPPPPDPKFNFLDDPGRKGDFQNHQRSSNNNNSNNTNRGRGKSKSFDVQNPPRDGVGRGRGGIMTKKDMELNMTGLERLDYQKWLDERARIDADRLARQQTTSGEWRREWDADKPAKSQENELPNQQNSRRSGQQQQQQQHQFGRQHSQGFDNFRPTGGNRNEQYNNNRNRGPYDNSRAQEYSRRPRRYSDSDDRGGNEWGSNRNNGKMSTGGGGGGGFGGFSVIPAADSGGVLPSRSPRVDAIETVKFSVRDADGGRNRQNFRNQRYSNGGDRRDDKQGGGGFGSGGGFDNQQTGGGSSGRRNYQRSPQNGNVGGGRGGRRSDFNNSRSSEFNAAGNLDRSKKTAATPKEQSKNSKTLTSSNNDQAAVTLEGNWDSDDISRDTPEKSIPKTENAAKVEEIVEGEEDQWEDVEEEGGENGGLAAAGNNSPPAPRRRAISEEYHRPGAEIQSADYEDEDEYVEPAEYGAFDKQRSESADFQEVQSDRQDTQSPTDIANDGDQIDALLNVARQRNKSMDQIEREMIDRLNENIEAVEAALGKHDEDFDAILYGARLDNDRNESNGGDEDADDSSDLASPIIGKVPNAIPVDPDVKVCVDSMVFTVST